MAEDFIQVAPDSTGKNVRNRSSVQAGKTVYQQVVAEVFNSGATLPDQSGAGGVLTFTFASAMDLIWIRSVGGVSRADPFGGTPTSTQGVYCADSEPQPITVTATTIKVYAPSGATVSVWGYAY